MYEFLVTKEELFVMFEMQEELNIKYNGTEWRKVVKLGQAKIAMLEELSEFNREIELNWKWWKNPSDRTYDEQKALFELVDMIHFALLLCLRNLSVDSNKIYVEDVFKHDASRLMYGKVNDQENQFIKSINLFLLDIDRQDAYYSICGLVNIINNGGILLDLKPGEIYRAYLLKNERNHERVDGGVMTGDYDKSKEKDLVL